MLHHPQRMPVPSAGHLPPLPITADLWNSVAHALKLSPRQVGIVELVLRGMEDQEITERLDISYSTLRTNFDRIGARTGAQGRNAIFRLVLRVSHEVKS